ncbi:von Willebrand factor A domain-containing protein 1 isoform X2 [Syngnathoides biaculeatus]|uniref:von Willebrand factor A domain-containing protein 1 isoform X2 n=1 Tax=Syngnathoides biaculeatus TaxID=300417 RepID=UPI002ADD926B|nr:von Willebrand factor A domain-containing protein 1 isoform X2 [Syngnathoides biaculeatus]XP_061656761.1 von Willebrand factor A domain-containing protein 1 isoform X2 [Syngnathoides biaculeatus]XP_061656770.1 von Willebrand factor A domain-containing protein 1 isoform X2 [Syngnathoides biaculeatus]
MHRLAHLREFSTAARGMSSFCWIPLGVCHPMSIPACSTSCQSSSCHFPWGRISLQAALKATKPLRGDTNTVQALKIAKDGVLRPGSADGARPGLPRVLVWLTDGVKPGDVIGPMAELRGEGVAVLVVSTGHSNYQVLRQVVSPPAENHLYFVDIDDMSIIVEDLRDAIIEIIRAEHMTVREVSSSAATLQWRPVLSGMRGYYEIRFSPILSGGTGNGGSGTGTSPSTGGSQYQRLVQSSDSNAIRLTGLTPDTVYTATLTPESNEQAFNTLSVTFTTQSEVQSPSVVTVSESGPTSVRVSWGPLQPEIVTSYYIEYSALPTGKLQTATVDKRQNSTLLKNLQTDTTYLVTVSARHSSGKEKAMSVKVCTQEVTPALADLQLTTVDSHSVQVDWRGSFDGLKGYWLTWEGEERVAQRSSLYLPPNSQSTRLTNLPPSARVCVSPIYKTARGEGLCCTAKFASDASTYGFQS